MGRLQHRAEKAREIVGAATRRLGRGVEAFVGAVVDHGRKVVDRDKWSSAADWRERIAAVSWPRAAVVTVLSTSVAVSLWMVLHPGGVRSHPPRLPTEQEWRATQAAAEAMEGDLSPALAAANRTEEAGAE